MPDCAGGEIVENEYSDCARCEVCRRRNAYCEYVLERLLCPKCRALVRDFLIKITDEAKKKENP